MTVTDRHGQGRYRYQRWRLRWWRWWRWLPEVWTWSSNVGGRKVRLPYAGLNARDFCTRETYDGPWHSIWTSPLRLYGFLVGTCYHKSHFTNLHRNFWVTGCGHYTLEGIIGKLRGRVTGRSPVLYVIVLAGNVNKAGRKILWGLCY